MGLCLYSSTFFIILIKINIETPDVEDSSRNMMIHFNRENFLDINTSLLHILVSVFKIKCLKAC